MKGISSHFLEIKWIKKAKNLLLNNSYLQEFCKAENNKNDYHIK